MSLFFNRPTFCHSRQLFWQTEQTTKHVQVTRASEELFHLKHYHIQSVLALVMLLEYVSQSNQSFCDIFHLIEKTRKSDHRKTVIVRSIVTVSIVSLISDALQTSRLKLPRNMLTLYNYWAWRSRPTVNFIHLSLGLNLYRWRGLWMDHNRRTTFATMCFSSTATGRPSQVVINGSKVTGGWQKATHKQLNHEQTNVLLSGRSSMLYENGWSRSVDWTRTGKVESYWMQTACVSKC